MPIKYKWEIKMLTKADLACKFLSWYFSLPTITKVIGVFDYYGKGKVQHLDFVDGCCIVWVGYKTKTKAFAYK